MSFQILRMVMLSGGMLATGLSQHALAATSASDVLSVDRAGEAADTIDLGSVKPIARPGKEAAKPLQGGNPLWAVPLSVLSATRERPIFSISRRPPQPAVVALPVTPVIAPPPPAGPEHPPLALIGAVVGDNDAIAVFLERSSQKIVRLRQGESHAGWLVSSVLGREVTLKKADQTEVMGLSRADSPAAAGVPGPAGPAGLAMPVAGAADGSYAPFIPRHTPKNGESDGL
jgi:general secretion pathway protein N